MPTHTDPLHSRGKGRRAEIAVRAAEWGRRRGLERYRPFCRGQVRATGRGCRVQDEAKRAEEGPMLLILGNNAEVTECLTD